jgi:hypothetical protein
MQLEDFGEHPAEDFGKLLPAEVRLIRGLRGYPDVEIDDAGFIVIGTDLPDAGDESRRIRAELIRWLALGGGVEAKTPERGLNVRGAWIDGLLDLRGASLCGDLGLPYCRFDARPMLLGARCASLFFNGAQLPGLDAARIVCSGSVVLLEAKASGEIRLLGAEIGGSLECSGALFEGEVDDDGEVGNALCADGVRVKGCVFLDKAKANGVVRLLGADIRGDLTCVEAVFDGMGGDALNAEGARITGSMFLYGGFKVTGGINFMDASCGALVDEEACWPDGATGWLHLSGFTYGALPSRAWDAESCLRWLKLNVNPFAKDGFHPQPYEQLAKVFRESGQSANARAVLIEKERLQRLSRRDRLRKQGARGKALALWRLFWDVLSGITVRYGRQPLWAFAMAHGRLVARHCDLLRRLPSRRHQAQLRRRPALARMDRLRGAARRAGQPDAVGRHPPRPARPGHADRPPAGIPARLL